MICPPRVLYCPARTALCRVVPQAQDFRIQYDSIVRVFLLPKANVPQTLVVISLDPPIRKGQTFYNHILCQVSRGWVGGLGGWHGLAWVGLCGERWVCLDVFCVVQGGRACARRTGTCACMPCPTARQAPHHTLCLMPSAAP
jgi:hypothetical protein